MTRRRPPAPPSAGAAAFPASTGKSVHIGRSAGVRTPFPTWFPKRRNGFRAVRRCYGLMTRTRRDNDDRL
ncbi:hypothetical protein C791_8559 [Amycolatopsis azurea DSM 43854]|uniref:Uncharacterized protein n=1 Tax=Amycolatopsis azurea DSM 43854 TaxID=1238180 RepID=M2NJR0_9PSEU|nr:hypothetical protein C791_8559 [Amycolatopsis azurea DSM 43854]